MASKEPVRLRRRKITTGLESLYLDIYIEGKREYEYLKLYLVPENNRADKEKNRATLALAEAIRARRVVEVREGKFGFNAGKLKSVFYDYYLDRAETKRRKGGSSYKIWTQAMLWMERYDRGLQKRTFREIDKEWVIGFRNYLDKSNLAQNTKHIYYGRLLQCLNDAYKDDIIKELPQKGVKNIKQEEGTRMYLTIDELRRLVDTPCRHESLRRAFLFSCLTGLRKSDIENLTWGEVHQQGDFTRIIFKQQKTGGQEYLDIAPEAMALMGSRKHPDDKVFENLPSLWSLSKNIREWCAAAGIDKDITFHCARHTFATMMLDLGIDLFTVSKLLGHREVKTTQIYAKVMDKAKQAAVMRIPSIINPKE